MDLKELVAGYRGKARDSLAGYLDSAREGLESGNVYRALQSLEAAKCASETMECGREVAKLRSYAHELLAFRVQHAARAAQPGEGSPIRSLSARCIDRYVGSWPTDDVGVRADTVVLEASEIAKSAIGRGDYDEAALGVCIAKGFLDLAARRTPQYITELEQELRKGPGR
ncbi:hypothetical protein KY362_02955 [Candidatus Woesearchaeota archaeon]|nr:hypothetical protein [Candidatus Woesearchaeota archaeon]